MYDYVVVGGGVAGLYLSQLLRDKTVLLLEEHENLGPRRCSGFISRRLTKFFELPQNIIEKEVFGAKLRCKDSCFEIGINSIVIDKEKFERFLLSRAKKNVEVRHERAIRIERRENFLTVTTPKGEYNTRNVIGCDGANSLVRRTFFNTEPKKFFFGHFAYSTEKPKPADCYEVFFDSKFSDLFAWKAPRRGKTEYGLIAEKNFKAYKERFFGEVQPQKILEEGFGVIPTGLIPCAFDRGILLGNAAGQTKPLTGGGVIYSLIAAQIAAKELNKKEPNFQNYEKKCRKILGREIWLQLRARQIYSKLNDGQKIKLLEKLTKRTKSLDMDFPMTGILKKNLRVFG